MSPKRQPRRDDLWDRTPGGVIVPRRVVLPTRRFIGKLGMAVDCCEVSADDVCPHCQEGTDPIWTVYLPEHTCGAGTLPSGTYVLDSVAWAYNLGTCACRYWVNPLSGSTITLRIANTGDVQVTVTWDPGGGAQYLLENYFTGDPPFPCYDISDLELPLVDWGVCSDPPEYVIVNNAA